MLDLIKKVREVASLVMDDARSYKKGKRSGIIELIRRIK